MQPQSDFEKEVADLIVESLNLEDIEAGEIDPEEPEIPRCGPSLR